MSRSTSMPVKSELKPREVLRAFLGRFFNGLGVLFVLLAIVVPIVGSIGLKPILGLTAGFFFVIAGAELGLILFGLFLQSWVGNNWVKTGLEECAAPGLPTLPAGTIVRNLKDSQGTRYLLLRLDRAINSGLLGDPEPRIVRDMLLVPHFSSGLMDRAPRSFTRGIQVRGFVEIGVLASPLGRDTTVVDQSILRMLGTGWIRRAQWMG